MANAYPRETNDFQPVQVLRDGLVVSTGLSFSIVPDGQRPVTFTTAVIDNGLTGVDVAGLTAGTYRIFAQLVVGSRTPVIDCGYFYIT
ncbi:MAG TPA: hypothetical protein DCR15_15865 [Arthrobacter bacterium]|nr:hypothetical protein [Arthrobacter sp.]